MTAAPSPEGVPVLSVEDGIATLRLRRPSQRNSLKDSDLDALLACLEQVNAATAVRVLVLRADTAGQRKPVFCAGYHVGGFDNDDHDPRRFERVADALEGVRPVTVCAMSGSVYGGATDLVLACDLRVGLRGTEWRMPAVALGLHLYPTGLRRYVTRLGIDGAKRAFLTARALPVEELDRLGLFDQLCDEAGFEPAVSALVQAAAALAPLAAQATKRSLNEIAEGLFDEQRLRGREVLTLRSTDFAEGRAAFAARRAPRFTGR